MRLLAIILFVLLLAGCADNNSTMKGIHAFDAEDYAIAHEELAPLAAKGNSEAQFYIGKMNYFGLGVPKDLDIAFVRYTDSAEQGYAKAQYNLGLMLKWGESVEEDAETGYVWISKAAAQGLDVAQFMMGVALSMEGSPLEQDIIRGLEYYEAAAQQNYPEAFTQLGQHFAFREGDDLKAGEYFDKAAALGDPQAMHRLSYIYMGDTLRTQDKEKAHNLLKASAEKNYLPSYYDLAMSYLWGNGIEQNPEEAIRWMQQSATQANDPRAMETLANILVEHRSGYLTQVPVLDSIESGVELRKKAAELGNSLAQLNLFVQYYNGTHVPANKAEAIKWLKASAENGNLNAQFELGRTYINDWGVLPQDQVKGVALYKSAAMKGHSRAIVALGAAYTSGLGVEKNASMALDWLKKAPEKEAALMIGMIYAQGGKGVQQDRELAEMWFRKSSDPGAKAMLPLLYMLEDYGAVDKDKIISLAQEVEPDLDGELRGTVQSILAVVYLQKGNWKDTIYWLTKASQSGSSDSQYMLGLLLLTGENVGKDIKNGRYWLTEASRNGDTDAALVLGASYMEDDGLGGGDLVSARYWLEIGEVAGSVEAVELIADLTLLENREARRFEDSKRLAEAEKARQKRERLERVEAQKMATYQARRSKRPSLTESLVGGFFKALGEGIGNAVSMKIDKELGVNRYDSNNLTPEKIREASRKGMRSALRQHKNLNSGPWVPPPIGYTTSGKPCNMYTC